MTFHDSEVVAEGQQVFTAVAFIHHIFGGVQKVFVARRAETKKFLPGVFELPGGHIDFGEDMAIGLKREIMEEFSMSVDVGDPFAVFTYKNDIKKSHSIEVVYFAKFTSEVEKIALNPQDHSEYRWVAESELGSIYSDRKGQEDQEYRAVRKGFAILSGESLETL